MIQPINPEQFNNAARQLKIRVKNDAADQQQLSKILFQILSYPSNREAQQHHRACNLGTLDLLEKQDELQKSLRNNEQDQFKICKCCGLMIKNQPLPYCVKFKQLKIGMGVILFFRNYFLNFFIFTALFIIYGLYAIITNLQSVQYGRFCNLQQGDDDSYIPSNCEIAALGGGSKVFDRNQTKDTYSLIQSALGIVIIILWGIALIIKRHLQRKYAAEMQTKRISASSFSLMITHFPKFYLSRSYDQNLKQIQNIFKRYEKDVNSKFSYDVIKYNVGKPLYLDEKEQKQSQQKKQKQREQRQQIFRNWIRYRKNHNDFPIPYQKRAIQYQKYVDFYSNTYDQKKQRQYRLDQTNLLFVTMRSSSAMRQIVQLNPVPSFSNLWNCCSRTNKFPIQGIRIRKAPQPEQIKFNKVGFPLNKKIFRKILIWLITLALIGISIGISIGIGYANLEEATIAISIGISLVITIINFGIQLAIMYLTYFQGQYINSIQQINIAVKIGIGQIINSIGVPIIVAAVASADQNIKQKKYLSAGGLVNDVFFIALFGLAVPLGRFIDPWEIFLKLKRRYHTQPYQKLKKYGQRQLNKYYGNYQFDIGYEYAYLIKTSIFTTFFACLQPIIILFAAIGIMLYYLADKRNLLRHFQRPYFHYPTIDFAVDLLLLLSLIAFGLGHLLVNSFLGDQLKQRNPPDDYLNNTQTINWVMTAIAGFFVIIVPLDIFYCCIERPKHPQWDFIQKQALIPTDYDRLNPQTRSKAVAQFEQYLRNLDKDDKLPDEGKMQLFMMSNIRIAEDDRKHKKQFTNSKFYSSHISEQQNMNSFSKNNELRYSQNVHQYQQYIRNKKNNAGSSDGLNGRDL